ncbi:MAG: hypothetical protein ACKOQ3_04875 [Novosphingobium sp.]
MQQSDEADLGDALKPRATLFDRIRVHADKAEICYLAALRLFALGLATIAVVTAIALVAWGAFNQISFSDPKPAPAKIEASDVAPPTKTVQSDDLAQPKATDGRLDVELRAKTIKVYRSVFQPFERAGTKVDENAVIVQIWSDERRKAFAALPASALNGRDDKAMSGTTAVQLDALATVEAAAKNADFARVLRAYKEARQTRVCRDQLKFRDSFYSGWDSTATTCPNWYENPMGCAVTRTEKVPYSEQVCEMKFPDSLESPLSNFEQALDRYALQASQAVERARIDAEVAQARINARKMSGRSDIESGIKLIGGFLLIMMLYLVVVMERHHRYLRTIAERLSLTAQKGD